MVLATRAAALDPAAEALRRLGVMRVATKYPRIASRYLQETVARRRSSRSKARSSWPR